MEDQESRTSVRQVSRIILTGGVRDRRSFHEVFVEGVAKRVSKGSVSNYFWSSDQRIVDHGREVRGDGVQRNQRKGRSFRGLSSEMFPWEVGIDGAKT